MAHVNDQLTLPTATANTFFQTLKDNPWAWLMQVVLTLMLATRAVTQIWSTIRSSDSTTGTRPISRIPYWIPYSGTTLLFSFRSQSWLLNQAKACHAGVFALHLSGRDCIFIASRPLQAQLSDPATPVSTGRYDNLRSRRFFSNHQVTHSTSSRISAALNAYNSDNSRLTKLTRLLETHAYNFISPSKSWVDQAQWERSAEVTVLSDSPALSITASLSTLIRDFSSYIMLSTLLGTSFVEANPGFISDFFTFGSKYATFMTGLPYWLAPGLGPPALARERCLLTLDGLINAIAADIEGRSMQGTGAGMMYDLDDVHPAIWDLVRQVRSEDGQTRTRKIACEVLEVIWHSIFASANMVIWILIHLSMESDSNKMALHSIREELKGMVEVIKPKPTGLPFEDPPRLKFSTDPHGKLDGGCPVMKGALLEVRRLETEAEEYLTVMNDFVLQSESTGSKGEKFQLKKGDHVYAAYGATNKDTQHWDRPRRFAPNRFISKNEHGTEESPKNTLPKMRSTYESVPQADVLCIAAALLAFYEIGSVDGGGLKHPGKYIVAGIGVPKHITAKVTRRPIK